MSGAKDGIYLMTDGPNVARDNAHLAFIAPFALFMIFTTAEGLDALKPYYPWVYSAKLAVVVGALLRFRRSYPALNVSGWWIGAAVGAVGLPVWVLLANIDIAAYLPAALRSQLVGSRAELNPWQLPIPLAGQWAFVAVRLFGLAVVVPIMEEIFWRGFLVRVLVRERFDEVPFGAFTPLSFAGTTLLFALVHPELLAALIWGASVNGVLYATRNLWACVLAHAVTNALLGAYILQTGAWQLW
jgi:CAAX prenyl protease-like protein